MTLSTPTLTPTETETPAGTLTNTPTATIDSQALYAYSTLVASGQPVAVIYSATAGEIGIMAINLAMFTVLLFMCFLLMVRSRNA
jgi:hypothetical protein